MIDESKIEDLCLKGESVTLDYKCEQYKFNGNKNEKSELLKDILSFANAWRDANACILIGVSEKNEEMLQLRPAPPAPRFTLPLRYARHIRVEDVS